jgi:hypothetical protein
MGSGIYKGYRIFGHAIHQQEDILLPERYAARGTIIGETKMVEASGILGVFDTKEEAQLVGLNTHGLIRLERAVVLLRYQQCEDDSLSTGKPR